MAESYEKRRRRKGRYEAGAKGDDGSASLHQSQAKPPMKILGLARPSRIAVETASEVKGENDGNDSNTTSSDGSGEKGLITVLSDYRHHTPLTNKSSDGGSNDSYQRQGGAPSEKSHSSEHQYPHLKRATIPSSVMSGTIDSNVQTPQAKLAPPLEKQTKTQLISDSLQWMDSGLELMLDQTDFLVVGVVGLQGCGKSTIVSLLAGNSQQDAYRNYVFTPQSKETKEDCVFQTFGVDMFVTPERIIYLDCQPLLSPAIMDCLMRYEKKLPSDYSSLQNFVEMQSMQLLTFLLSVCNIVLIVDDWFIDMNLLRFIQDAEMLKPSQPPTMPSSDNQGNKEDNPEFFPTVVFIHNKASQEDFNPQTYNKMQSVLHCVFSSSKLRHRTGINMINTSSGESLIQIPAHKEQQNVSDINLILLPLFEFYKCDPDCLETTMPDYRGYPSFNTILSFLRSQILSGPRSPLTHSTLTEKNWYHFAARIWDSIRKSSLLGEYNRLLSAP